MSSGGLVGGVVGAAIGFVVSGGNPMGAVYGWFIGSTAGSILFPEQMQGPRIEDLKAQASTLGWCVPKTYGTNRHAGNVIWQPPLIEVATEQDAKGGPEVTTFTYFAHAAVLVCEGEIAGIRRIWANKRLIYDARTTNTGPQTDPVISAMRIYKGTETQMPDPLIVAQEGDSPAYRGWAYVVFENLGLSDHFGNRLPGFEFEVVEKGETEIPPPQEIGTTAGGESSAIASDNGELWTADGIAGSPQICRATVCNPATLQELAEINQPESAATGGITAMACVIVGQEFWVINGAAPIADPVMIFNRVTRSYVESISPPWSSFIGGGYWDERFTGQVYAFTSNFGGTVYNIDPTTRLIVSEFGVDGSVSDAISVLGPLGNAIAFLCSGGKLEIWPAIHNYTISAPDLVVTLSNPDYAWPGGRLDYDESRNKVAIFANRPVPEARHMVVVDVMTGIETDVDWAATFGTRYAHSRNGVYHPRRDKYYVQGTDDQSPPGYYVILEVDPVSLLPIRTILVDQAIVLSTADELHVPKDGDTFLVWVVGGGGDNWAYKVPIDVALEPEDVSLADIVRDIAERCGLDPVNDLDVTALEPIPVKGYTLARQMTGRAAIEPLQAAFFFDMVESDDKLKAVVRGGGIAVTIPEDERGAHEPGSEKPAGLEITRLQELESPANLEVRFIDINRDYEDNVAPAKRLVRASKHQTTVHLPIVMNMEKASQVAAVNLYLTWQRARYAWKTGRKYAKYEPSDVAALPTAAATYNVRVTQKREHPNGLIEWEGASEDAAIYSQNGVASAVSNYPAQTIIDPGVAVMQLLDIPILRDEDNNAGFYAAYATSGTAAGCSLYKSSDGVAYALVKQMTAETPMGYAGAPLASSTKGNVFDYAQTLRVTMIEGELASDTKLNVLNGANLAVYGDEIIQFLSATLVSPGVYDLTGLLRGRFGTERAMSEHASGERFVVVSASSWRRIVPDISEIGLQRSYKAPLFGASLSGASPQAFTNNAVGLEPYAGCQLKGARDGSNNLTGTWKRRTRIGGGWRDLVDVGVGELSEAYEVEIWDAGYTTLKRTIAGLTTPSFTYSAADQTTDFGAPQNPVAVRAFQMSSVVGRGFKLEGSI